MFNKKAESHFGWKGDKASYHAKHRWISRNWPRPKRCKECGIMGIVGKGGRWTIDYANISGKFLRVIEDWKPLCRKCHRAFDYKFTSFSCRCCAKVSEGKFNAMRKFCDECNRKKDNARNKIWKRIRRASQDHDNGQLPLASF